MSKVSPLTSIDLNLHNEKENHALNGISNSNMCNVSQSSFLNESEVTIENQNSFPEKKIFQCNPSIYLRPEEDVITLTGTQLRNLIKEHVHEFLKEELR